jgi:hypothetical protein
MNPKLRNPLVLALSGLVALATQAAGNAVNTMGAPYFDAQYETYAWPGVLVDSGFVDNTGSIAGTIGVNAVIGSLWNSLPALQQAVVTNDGATFWSRASSPFLSAPPQGGTVNQGEARVSVAQSFTKTGADAELRFTYSGGLLESFRDPELRPDCAGFICTGAAVIWEVSLWRNDTPSQPILMSESGWAELRIEDGVFRFSQGQDALDGTPVNPLWSWDCARCNLPALGLGQARLQAPFTGIVDLSAIPFDPAQAAQPEFTVLFTLTASAFSDAAFVGATAWARDPLDLGNDAGIGLTVFDLQPTNNPIGVVPEPAGALLLGVGATALLAWRRRSSLV